MQKKIPRHAGDLFNKIDLLIYLITTIFTAEEVFSPTLIE
jgi:hypothetical protein